MQAGFDFCSIEIYIFDRFNTGGTKLCTIGLLQMFVACFFLFITLYTHLLLMNYIIFESPTHKTVTR